jgi:hypothetical protein
MKIKRLPVYNGNVSQCVNNEYRTSPDTFKQPCLQMVVGQRTAGKSYLTSKMLAQAVKDKTFDVIYMITPSFNSNKAYFGAYIDEKNVFSPTKSSISEVIKRVEADRDEWEQYCKDVELYRQYTQDMKRRGSLRIYDEDALCTYYEKGFYDKPPEWKYEFEEPPKSLLIMDDCLGSRAILQSSGLTRIATLNRHIAPLKEDHKERSACGLAVIILCQTYKMNNGIGRCLRENLSLLTLFKNKQQKQLDAIKDELANVIDLECFDSAYEFATKEKYGNLTIDFAPKCTTKVFRKNLNEVIKFPQLKCECGGNTIKSEDSINGESDRSIKR